MSNNNRIAKNTLYLYFRMLLLMVITLYTSRVTLNILGVEDFGIYNIVGGVVVLFAFLARSLNSASSRFLSVAIASNDEIQIQKTFSTILVAHIFLVLIVLVLLETVGLLFVLYKMNIPDGKEVVTIIVYQFAVLSTCLNIIRTPFNASIIANEQMNFYAYTSIVEGIIKLVIVWILLLIPFDRLSMYSFLMMLSILFINVWYIAYCVKKFKGNRIVFKTDKFHLKPILSFSGWNLFNGVADIGWQQGTNIILNMFYGVTLNATMGITNQIRSAIFSFVANLQTAANPQIIKSYSKGENGRFEKLLFAISKYSYLLMLFFTVPLCFNMNYILSLWLVKVPEHAVEFTILILIFSMTDTLSGPLWVSVQANGKVKVFSIIYSTVLLLNVPATYLLFYMGYAPEWMLLARIILNIIGLIWEVIYVRWLIGIDLIGYIREVINPIVIVTMFAILVTYFAKDVFTGFYSLIFTFLVSSVTILFTTILCGMNTFEKSFFLQNIVRIIKNQ